MKIVTIVSRILLGVVFLIFGANGFFHFIPQPPMPDSLATRFSTAMMQSHYFLVVSAVEVVSALLFLFNRYVPLGLTLIGPVVVNILLFHIFLLPSGLAIAALVAVLWFIVFYAHRAAFAPIFESRS